ncbi:MULTISPECIES: hypothetical protein [Providencia]|nr:MULTISPECIES: hypothetical protein [Providencia]
MTPNLSWQKRQFLVIRKISGLLTTFFKQRGALLDISHENV